MKDKIYIIVLKDDVSSEDDIFVVRAKDREEALYNYAKDYYSKDEIFIEMVEDRAINGGYWCNFFENIFDFDMQGGYTTDLTDSEIRVKLKENINTYLVEHQQYAEILFDFYDDESKTIKDLDNQLYMIMALKSIYQEIEYYIVKEINL